MSIITLEEHITFPEIAEKVKQTTPGQGQHWSAAVERLAPKLADVTGERLASMDAHGISRQVLSVAGPGADLLDGEAGIELAKEYNDAIALRIAGYRERFNAFAHLPMRMPEAAADELDRAVNKHQFCGTLISGLTNNEFLDDPKYAPIFKKAQDLDVPIYLHPGIAPQAVQDAYYNDLPKQAGQLLSIAGWGWHSETALHVLRLIESGTFDKYPKLKLIVGHMGEMLPMMMARCDNMFKPGETGANQRSISQTLKDQVYITTSGLFTQPPFQVALSTFGIDRILFAVDYPFSPNEAGKKFLSELQLNDTDYRKLTYENAAGLLKLN